MPRSGFPATPTPPRFHSHLPGFLGLLILPALFLAVPSSAAAAARPEQAISDARVDSHLRSILGWIEGSPSAAAGVRAGFVPAGPFPASSADVERPGLPATVDYGRATFETTVQLLIEGDVSRADLEAAGALVNTQAGGVTTVLAPLAAVPALLEVPRVLRISAAEAVRPMLDVSAPEVDADQAWEGVPPVYLGVTGKNVVVGIVDSGIDLNHADFRSATNQTRIKYAWDQTWTGTKPAGFNYGAEWTAAQINAGTASSLKDYDGHGTHVAGIAAGNGRATGNGQLPYRYVGIAPEADLVIVKTNFTDAGIIDGVNYIFQKAAALGKPAVVNLSVGTQKGAHDGTHTLDTAISALTGVGKLVTAAAGNYGLLNAHDQVDLALNQSTTVPFSIPTYIQSTTSPEYITVEGWHAGGGAFKVKLKPPTGTETAWINPGQSSGVVTISAGTYLIENGITTNSKGAKQIKISIYRTNSTSPHPQVGTWTLTVSRNSGTSTGTCHFWISTWFFDTTGTPMFTTPSLSHSIASPATGDQVISTGAYVTKTQWVNGNGGTSSYGEIPLGTLADFSSTGPRRDGVQRPDVVAPGYGVAAALGANAPTSNSYKVLDRVHYMRLGTSQANAHTTGALALKLQETPDLTPSLARQEIIDLAREDAATGATPNAAWGYGKLDVINLAVGIGEPPAPGRFALGLPYPNPSSGATNLPFSLGSAEAAAPSGRAVLRIFDAGGRQVASVAMPAREGVSEISWDGLTDQGRPAPAGVYFARLEVEGRRTPVRKLVRLER